MLISWMARLLARRGRVSRRQAADRRAAPQLEALEDRAVPSVTLQFDYTYDASDWFTSQRRSVLELAGRTLGSRLNDALAAIAPASGDFWQATFWHPSNGTATHVTNLTVPANTLIIYAGAYAIDGRGSTIARAGFGGAGNISGSSAFQNAVLGRRAAPVDSTRDFQPWGGQITFDTTESWYFGVTAGATAQQTDFLSVALHELGHILGVSEYNPSFAARISNRNWFAGPQATVAYGGPVPLDAEHAGRSHWAHEVRHAGHETLMDPYIAPGQRKLATGLDWAGLGDVGWELSVDPDATLAGARSVHDPLAFAASFAGLTTTYASAQFALTEPLDVDMFLVHAAAGQTMTIQTTPRAGQPTTDTFLRLFDSSGRELHRADTGGYDTLTYTITTTGTYYLGISSNPNTAYSATEAFAQSLAGTPGAYDLTIRLTGNASAPLIGPNGSVILVAPDAGSAPLVRVFDTRSRSSRHDFYAYTPSFTGGVRVALGDVSGDGIPDIITAPGPGSPPYVRVFDGRFGNLLREFYAYGAGFTGGIFVAAGDLNRDGKADIITGVDAGAGPHVRAFSGADQSLLADFFAYNPAFTGGVRVATSDYNGDGQLDIVTAAGRGGGPHVRVFSGAGLRQLADFFAYDVNFTGGVYIAASDLDGDGKAELITGAGAGGGPHVKVFRGGSGTLWRSFFAFDAAFTGGVRAAAADINGDGHNDLIVAAGPGGGPHIRAYAATSSLALADEFFAFAAAQTTGLFIAAP